MSDEHAQAIASSRGVQTAQPPGRRNPHCPLVKRGGRRLVTEPHLIHVNHPNVLVAARRGGCYAGVAFSRRQMSNEWQGVKFKGCVEPGITWSYSGVC